MIGVYNSALVNHDFVIEMKCDFSHASMLNVLMNSVELKYVYEQEGESDVTEKQRVLHLENTHN